MFKVKKAGDFFHSASFIRSQVDLFRGHCFSSEVKKKKKVVYGVLYFVSIRKQLFCQILLYRLTVIYHRLLKSEGKPISWTSQLR